MVRLTVVAILFVISELLFYVISAVNRRFSSPDALFLPIPTLAWRLPLMQTHVCSLLFALLVTSASGRYHGTFFSHHTRLSSIRLSFEPFCPSCCPDHSKQCVIWSTWTSRCRRSPGYCAYSRGLYLTRARPLIYRLDSHRRPLRLACLTRGNYRCVQRCRRFERRGH